MTYFRSTSTAGGRAKGHALPLPLRYEPLRWTDYRRLAVKRPRHPTIGSILGCPEPTKDPSRPRRPNLALADVAANHGTGRSIAQTRMSADIVSLCFRGMTLMNFLVPGRS